MKLEDYSIDQLHNEINRRKFTTPKALSNPDFTTLVNYLERLVVRVESENFAPKNFEEYTFQLAMDVVFGPGSWRNWWNEKVNR